MEYKDGIYHDLGHEVYHGIDAVSSSFLRRYYRDREQGKSIWHTIHQAPKQTKAMSDGQLYHAAILEPHKFESMYVIGPEVSSKATKKWKEWAAEQDQSKMLFKPSEFESKMERIRNARRYFDGEVPGWIGDFCKALDKGQKELALIWTDKDRGIHQSTGLKCKAMIDIVGTVGGKKVCADLKFTDDASDYHFRKQARNWGFGYGAQDDWYRRGCEAVGIDVDTFVFIAIEKPTGFVRIIEIGDDIISQGRNEVNDDGLVYYMREREHKEKTGEWRKYPDGLTEIKEIS